MFLRSSVLGGCKLRKVLLWASIVAVAILIINGAYVTIPAYLQKSKDPRNEKVTMVAHLRWGVDPSTLVVDLVNVRSDASMADVDRSMLDIADALKGRTFTAVQLAYRGSGRFQMTGSYFRTIGEERGWQNPVYTFRTMPENMMDMAGKKAFETWTGGVLGVLNKQLEDHNDLHRQWYINAIASN